MANVVSVSLQQLPGALPGDVIPADYDISSAASFVKSALEHPSQDAFTADALWRDWMVYTDKVRTRVGPEVITGVWQVYAQEAKPSNMQTHPAMTMRQTPGHSWVEVPIAFTAKHLGQPAQASGSASLIPHGSSWKIWSLVTILESLDGVQHPDVWSKDTAFPGRIVGGLYGGANEPQAANGSKKGPNFYEVIIVGGGQAGLSTAARMSGAGISNLVIEKQDLVGAAWSRRYDSVHLHTIKQMNTLPYDKTFADEEPTYMTGRGVGASFDKYAQKYGLNMRMSAQVTSSKHNTETGIWDIGVTCDDGEKLSLQCRHLVLAIGQNNTKPRFPSVPGIKNFKGKTIHSIDWKNAKGMAGKRVVVIGSGTNAHDTCQDLLAEGVASVTMIQRHRTAIFPVEHAAIDQEGLFNNPHISLEMADRIALGKATKHNCMMADIPMWQRARENPERFDALERAGFRVDRKSGMYDLVIRFGGSYYIDVGASPLIASGDIKVKSGVPITKATENALVFADETELPADVIVFATGYELNFAEDNARIVGTEIANKLGPWWGLDAEGELRGAMVQEYPGLWRLAGGPSQVRFYSRFISLCVQTEMLQRGEKV